MKNAFNRLISRPNAAEEIISTIEDVLIELPKTEKQGGKNKTKQKHRTEYPSNVGQQKHV